MRARECVCVCVCVRERERGGGERQTDRQTDRQTERQTEAKVCFCCRIMRLHSNGVSSHLFEKWFPQATCSTPTGPMVISLMHLEGMRFVLPVALGLALLGLAAELLCFKSVQQA